MTLRWAPMSSAGISGRGFRRGQHDLGLDPPLELFVQAFNCIRCPDRFPLAFWGPHLVRQASPGQRKWPKISNWHVSHDEVVAPANASALVRQWIDIHHVDEAGATQDEVDGQTSMSWRDSSGALSSSIMPSTGFVPWSTAIRRTERSQAPLSAAFFIDWRVLRPPIEALSIPALPWTWRVRAAAADGDKCLRCGNLPNGAGAPSSPPLAPERSSLHYRLLESPSFQRPIVVGVTHATSCVPCGRGKR
jgi:hypothetical protein